MGIRSWFECARCRRLRGVDDHGFNAVTMKGEDTAVCDECIDDTIIFLAEEAAAHWDSIKNQVDPGQCDVGFVLDPLADFIKAAGRK